MNIAIHAPELVPNVPGDWDLSYFFQGYLGPDYRAAWQSYRESIERASAVAAGITALEESNIDQVAQLFLSWEELYQMSTKLATYLECLRAADGRDETVARECAALQALGAEQKKLDVQLLDLLKRAEDSAFRQLTQTPPLADARFRLERWREAAHYQMKAELETLAADLEVVGMSAWGRLYEQLAGRLVFDMPDEDGETKTIPMSLKRSLTESPDPLVRKAAQENSNRAWQEVEDVCSACLNSIAGTRLTLYKRRGVPHFLEPSRFQAAISAQTLDAMMEAIRSRYEIPRDYLRLKARIVGLEKLGFQDLSCPLPLSEDQTVNWTQAGEWLAKAYGQSYPAFAEFCSQALTNRWIDYQTRPGKRPGGFCTCPLSEGESRIFMTFNNTMGDVQTLAHELGHAHHNWVLRRERPLNLLYPMTLAETASTFAETLLTDAMLASPDTSAQLKASLLNTRLDQAAAFMLNIPMRFDFECQFYEERAHGEVSVSRIKEIMLQAQRACYGDTLAPDQEDPFFWASKQHFYITEVSFYNFPYAFGYLFSLGVCARARKEGPAFYPKYEDLLRRAGSDTAENVAQHSLGVNLKEVDFWLDSIALIEEDAKAFRAQVASLFPGLS